MAEESGSARATGAELLSEAALAASASLKVPPRPRRVRRVPDDLRPRPPGTPYAYQEAAYALLEGDEKVNLLVASPTGSGKTSVIIKAADVAARRGQRIVVAEPLIALVEQVYAKLVASLPGVHVDMRTGPSVKEAITGVPATVTVCTYEVLASACSSACPARLVSCCAVVVDEFHFIGEDRGPVIQEILDWSRSSSCPIVALSGTLINDLEVAEFLSGVNGLPTVVLGAARRPVPLTFYYYDVQAPRSDMSFSVLRERPHNERRSESPDYRTVGGLRGRQDVLRLVAGLKKWDCMPALVVTFSCKKLDQWAEDAASGHDFLNRHKKQIVSKAFWDMLRKIPREDRVLFERLERLAQLGIGLHHSHLPVQYLELVSHLAENRCLGLVFSTSTLSAGINLPVRTVCLCGARLPRKAEGEMTHEVLDPLMFQQLAGRAGRPGYETVGNVVVVGTGWAGWHAAASLLERPLPPVRPTSAFTSGDVLRAALTGRRVALDRLVFSSSAAAQDAERAQLSRLLGAKALSAAAEARSWGQDVEDAMQASARHCSDLLKVDSLVLREKSSVPLARNDQSPLWLIDAGRRGFKILEADTEVEASEDARRAAGAMMPLTRKQATAGSGGRCPRLHASLLEAALRAREVREALAAVWRTVPESRDQMFWTVASALRNAEADKERLEDNPDIGEYVELEDHLREKGYLNAAGAPTRKGRAASFLRSCEKPEVLIELLLSEDDALDKEAYLRLGSLVMGAGARLEEPPEDAEAVSSVPGEAVLMEALTEVSAPSYNTATHLWAAGSSLFEIEEQTGISCGQFARHVVRVNSLLCEIAFARKELGLRPSSQLTAASRALCRGLPFARRGGGRVALGHPEEAEASEEDLDSSAAESEEMDGDNDQLWLDSLVSCAAE